MQNYMLRVSIGISDEDPDSIEAMQEVITAAARDIAIKASLLGLHGEQLLLRLTRVPVVGAPIVLSLDDPPATEDSELLSTVIYPPNGD